MTTDEQKYRLLFYSNPMPMWVIDISSFAFLDVNDAAVTHYGYSREEFLSMTTLDIRPAEDVSLYLQARHPQTITSSEYNRGIWRHCKKDGSIIQVEIMAHDIMFEGRHARFILANDITARLAAEEAVKTSQQELRKLNEELEDRIQIRTRQLEAANKELESFSYSVSHDLRAPLRGIAGFTAILEEEYVAQLDDEAKRLMGIIKKNTLRMGFLIDGLLSFSRMTRQDIVKAPVHTDTLVKEVIEELAPAQKISWQLGTLPTVQGDHNTLRQVWMNLLSNAIKYSRNREHPHISINHTQQDGWHVFEVQDNGVGFDNQYRDKLFHVFQRLHSLDEFEGTGVGLALVEKIVSKHGGLVWAEGETDKGARFYFSLPA